MHSKAPWPLPGNFRIDDAWFDHSSSLHGRRHTLRVMLLADSLYSSARLRYSLTDDRLYRDLMTAALIHDLARKHDGFCLEHGLWARQSKRPIAEKYFLGFMLGEDEWEAIGQAVEAHSRPDPVQKYPGGTLTALLKDADGLDRIRLGYPPDPAYFRHPFTEGFIGYAHTLLSMGQDLLEIKLFTVLANHRN